MVVSLLPQDGGVRLCQLVNRGIDKSSIEAGEGIGHVEEARDPGLLTLAKTPLGQLELQCGLLTSFVWDEPVRIHVPVV
eukprot:13063263-Heterocapsa_arctica.AAC.1